MERRRFFPGFPPTANERDFERNFIRVGPSTIKGAGRGVFAKRGIERGTRIGVYRGEALTNRQFAERYPHGSVSVYALDIGGGITVDGVSVGSSWTALINDALDSGNDNNVRFGDKGALIAERNIHPGEELFVAYGDNYWRYLKRLKRKKK